MSELVTRRDLEGVAVLTLNRPDALNALSPNMFVELRNHVDAIAEQTDAVGVVVLRGEGRSFSAGNDLKAIQAGERAPTPHFQAETLEAIENLPQPVIAAVQGHCYTGSLELALACDLMITAESVPASRRCAASSAVCSFGTWALNSALPTLRRMCSPLYLIPLPL